MQWVHVSKAHSVTATQTSQSRWVMTFATWSKQDNTRYYDLNSPSFVNGERRSEVMYKLCISAEII